MAGTQSVEEFFETLPSRVPAEKMVGMTNSYLFEITDVGTWRVAVADGAVTVTKGEADADVRITMSEPTFHKLVEREQSPTRAAMSGKLKFKGDVGVAMKLGKLLG